MPADISPKDTVIDLIQKAETHCQQQNWQAAMDAYQEAIQQQPEYATTYVELAKLLQQLGKNQQAAETWWEALQRKPEWGNTDDYLTLGNHFVKQQSWSKAIACYQQAIATNSQAYLAHHNLGEIYSYQQQWQEAISHYRQAIAINPDFPNAYHGLGKVFASQQEWEKAADCYQQAIAKDLATFAVYSNLGKALENLGDSQAAIDTYQQAYSLNPQAADVCIRLGNLQLQQENYDAAISRYLEAIRLQPKNVALYVKLRHLPMYKQVTFSASQIEKMIDTYNQVIANIPDFPESYVNLGELFTQQGEIEKAIATYQKGIHQYTLSHYQEFANDTTLTTKTQPDFLIIGVMKSGTTSLYKYLTQHPQILPCLQKEIHFFDWQFHLGLDWYLSQFPPHPQNQQYLSGEATPGYLFNRFASQNIYQSFPQTKLILILRNPIDRTISHYYDQVNWIHIEQRDLQAALAREIETLKRVMAENDVTQTPWKMRYGYVSRSLYVYFLQKWLELFPREQILILRSEDLYTNPQATMRQVFAFLNLPDYQLPHYPQYVAGSYNPVNPQIRQMLAEFFHPHTRKLEETLGKSMDWQQ
jgi:tetratricopeptide (TPR) repeat protein